MLPLSKHNFYLMSIVVDIGTCYPPFLIHQGTEGYRFVTQMDIFEVFIPFNFNKYGSEIIKTITSVSQKI